MEGAIDEVLVWLVTLKDVLAKGMEWGLSPILGSSSQLDCVDWMSMSHGEECVRDCVI
jgi:hypothetical protein